MILWLALFLLIIAISFLLAFQSMKDYQEIPQDAEVEYGLFLIRQTKAFSTQTLDLIHRQLLKEGLIISLERLFKGDKSALVLFGPKKVLQKFQNELDLLELEDYSKDLEKENIFAWEISIKKPITLNLPKLESNEQFWFQVVLGQNFRTQIRAAVFSENADKRKQFPNHLENLSQNQLIKMPVPFSSAQILNFYQLRSLAKNTKGVKLNAENILQILTV